MAMKKILILDDEDNLRALYKQILVEQGYSVVTASEGTQALKILSKQPCDLAIVDVKLGNENGLEYMRQMMTMRQGMKVIINTAYSTFKQDFQAWSADAYLMKSSDSKELLATVNRLLQAGKA
ncbi:MAG: response regulator [Calditrichaeota bacterium]|nr:MAG: response regulator [Calditrichota bacterium]